MGDESVCELLEVGLGMLARARLTEGLRNSAGVCVQAVVRAVFARLKSLTPENVEKLVQVSKELEEKEKAKIETSKPERQADQDKEETSEMRDELPVTREKLSMEGDADLNRVDVTEGKQGVWKGRVQLISRTHTNLHSLWLAYHS